MNAQFPQPDEVKEVERDSDNNIVYKDYSTHSNEVLNRLIRLRARQIRAAEKNPPAWVGKSLLQLKYEQEAMINVLMERGFAL